MTHDGSPALRADCARCTGLCCVAPVFARSADFAVDKPAGTPCRNLMLDDRCGIHDSLRDKGFAGCTVFDCLGAGQRVTQVTFGGRSWREDPALAGDMFAAFDVMRGLHELLRYLAEAGRICPDATLAAELTEAFREVEALSLATPERLLAVDVDGVRSGVNPLLDRCSRSIREAAAGPAAELRGADLFGQDLRDRDLRAASLRGALLVGADLRGVDLSAADLTGADLRGADVRGADLSRSLFLLQAQLDSTRGDHATGIPPGLAPARQWW